MKIQPASKEALDLLHQGTLALARVEEAGIRIDRNYLERAVKAIQKQVYALEAWMKQTPVYRRWEAKYGVKASLGSAEQLGDIVFNELGHKATRFTAKTGRYATDEEAFKDVPLPFLRVYFKAKKLQNTSRTFLSGLQREITPAGFIHPMFNLNTAVSYRSSGQLPNPQNWPRRNDVQGKLVRQCFIPRYPDWQLWELDFKGSEVCRAADICLDPTLIDYCKDPKKDMHRDMAAQIFFLKPEQVSKALRDRVKNQFVFAEFYGSFYGLVAPRLWDDVVRGKLTIEGSGTLVTKHLRTKGITALGALDESGRPPPLTFMDRIRTVEQDFWERRFKVYAQWKREFWENYLQTGHYLTPIGFRVSSGKGGVLSRNDCINYIIQGTSFHCLLWTLIRLQEWIEAKGLKTRLCNQIHDSIVGDSPPEELGKVLDKAKQIVTEDLPKHWPWLVVPTVVEIEVAPPGKSWWHKEP
jgi:DNA polymerase-1